MTVWDDPNLARLQRELQAVKDRFDNLPEWKGLSLSAKAVKFRQLGGEWTHRDHELDVIRRGPRPLRTPQGDSSAAQKGCAAPDAARSSIHLLTGETGTDEDWR